MGSYSVFTDHLCRAILQLVWTFRIEKETEGDRNELTWLSLPHFSQHSWITMTSSFFGYECGQGDKWIWYVYVFLPSNEPVLEKVLRQLKFENLNIRKKKWKWQAWIIQRQENLLLIVDRTVKFCISMLWLVISFENKGYSFGGKECFMTFKYEISWIEINSVTIVTIL